MHASLRCINIFFTRSSFQTHAMRLYIDSNQTDNKFGLCEPDILTDCKKSLVLHFNTFAALIEVAKVVVDALKEVFS